MKQNLLLFSALAFILAACAPDRAVTPEEVSPVHQEKNAVYYWKTVFSPDSLDRDFLKKHDIGRIYLRMFDVAADVRESPILEDRVIPNATVRISDEDYGYLNDSLSHIEFVPVVYITLDALKTMEGYEEVLASNIVSRVDNMCAYNSLPLVKEIQLDCDWTQSTERSFFALCDSVRSNIRRRDIPWRLSSTIRLHQLSRPVPPVDNGVLMVYNTGSFDNPDAKNSIIDREDVEPYLRHLANYPLHLDVAYPTYSWQLLFRNRKFAGLLNGLDLTDRNDFTPCGPNKFMAVRDIPYRNRVIYEGDIVRSEISAFKDIDEVKKLIESHLSERPHSNILYHLDSNNLSNYSDNEISSLFAAGR
ncbi:MAG: hypothetical protein K2K84_01060 [Muribaculaceae bacterium]|nr:hypothetical protein [Muribaculaceae bacterium]